MMSMLILPMLKPLAWLLLAAIVAGILKSPAVKGWLGEQRVRRLIRDRLDPVVYREFYNVTLRTEHGTTQIDHVYVSRFGVFVIETKNMGHWIRGGRHQPTWTQIIYRQKFPFYNPLWQNGGHVKALQSLLAVPERIFHPILVFAGDCTFKSEMPPEVRTCKDLIAYMRLFDQPVLSREDVEGICRELERLRLAPTRATHREHVESLRRRHGHGVPASSTPAAAVAQFAAEAMLSVIGDRVGARARGYARNTVVAAITAAAIKGLLALFVVVFIWWAFTHALTGVARSVQNPNPVSTTPTHAPTEATRAPGGATMPRRTSPPPPMYYHPTAEESAAHQRRAEDAMRVLTRSTREIHFADPDSPAIGPLAGSARAAHDPAPDQ